jgi:hypothetical protein
MVRSSVIFYQLIPEHSIVCIECTRSKLYGNFLHMNKEGNNFENSALCSFETLGSL